MLQTRSLSFFVAVISAHLLLLGVVATPIVSAHSSGASVEREVGEYLIDIGYEPTAPTAGGTVRMDLELYELATGADVPYTDAWILIEKSNKTYFAGGVPKARIGATGFSYLFPEAGEYEIYVRYQQDGEKVVETTFPFTVNESDGAANTDGGPLTTGLAGLAGLVIGVIAGFYLRKFI